MARVPGADVGVDLDGLGETLIGDDGAEVGGAAGADGVAEGGDLEEVFVEAVEDGDEDAGGWGGARGQEEGREREGVVVVARGGEGEGPPVEGGEGVADVVVHEEFPDELPEARVLARLLGRDELARAVHVDAVFAFGVASGDGDEALHDGGGDGGVFDHEGGARFGAALVGRFDVGAEDADGVGVVMFLTFVEGGSGVTSGEVGARECHEGVHQAFVLGGHG